MSHASSRKCTRCISLKGFKMTKRVVVEGEIVVREGHNNSQEFFENEVFLLDDAVATKQQAMSILKKGLLAERFRKRDGFKRVREFFIVEFSNTQEQAESGDLDKLLIRASELGCMPENLGNYKRPDHKLKALEKAIATAEARKAKVDTKEQDLGYID